MTSEGFASKGWKSESIEGQGNAKARQDMEVCSNDVNSDRLAVNRVGIAEMRTVLDLQR